MSYAAPPDAGRPARLALGQVVSYDAAAHTCLVALDTGQAPVQLPVAGHVPGALVPADTQVAIALFSLSDPGDGLVLGPFPSSPPPGAQLVTQGVDPDDTPTFAALNVGSAAGAATGAVRAASPTGGTFTADSSAANSTPYFFLVDNGTLMGFLTFAGANAAGFKYVEVISTSSADGLLLGASGAKPILFYVNDALKASFGAAGGLNLGASYGAPTGQLKSNQNSIAGDVIANLQNLSATGYGVYIGGGDATRYALKVGDYAGNQALELLGSGVATFAGKLTAPAFQTTADAYTNVAASRWGAILTNIAADSVYLIYAYNDYNGYYAFGIGMRLGVGAAIAIALSASGGMAFQGNGNNIEVYNAVAATRTIHFITTRLQ